MDVAVGAQDVSFYKRRLGVFLGLILLPWFVWGEEGTSGKASPDQSPVHWSGERTVWNRRDNIVELFGRGRVTKKGEVLEGNYVKLNLETRFVDAVGEAYYRSSGVVINADEIHFGMDDGIGSIVRGKVSDGHFLLRSDFLEKTGPQSFKTLAATYTTCQDCSASWSFEGSNVTLEVEGYATMTNVKARIKDAPVVWLPFLMVPVKKKRQTGLLMPKFNLSSSSGFSYLQRFFLALSDESDMTFGAAWYSTRGRRLDWEGRYRLDPESFMDLRFVHINDITNNPVRSRWSGKLNQQQRLPLGLTEKALIQEVSDNSFPVDFMDDAAGREDSTLGSTVQISHSSSQFSGFVEARRYRNLLKLNDSTSFDDRTVQVVPRIGIASSDRSLLGSPVSVGLRTEATRFTRTAGNFDKDLGTTGSDYVAGIDPLREATRASFVPKVYATLRPFDIFALTPQVEYRSYFYNFQEQVSSLSRGYLLLQTDLSLQLERVWDTDSDAYPKMKHLVRPTLRYSRIPLVNEPNHPFINQIQYRSGYAFDNDDYAPLTTTKNLESYTVPQANSISYGLVTQWVRKSKAVGLALPSYETVAELTAGQTMDFTELRKAPNERITLSRLYATALLRYERLGFSSNYYYYPYLSRLLPGVPANDRSPHELNASLSIALGDAPKNYEYAFSRSISFGYGVRKLNTRTETVSAGIAYSLSDYFLPSLGGNFDLLTSRMIYSYLDLAFRSPSRCWSLTYRIENHIDRGWDQSLNFALDFTGQKGLTL